MKIIYFTVLILKLILKSVRIHAVIAMCVRKANFARQNIGGERER